MKKITTLTVIVILGSTIFFSCNKTSVTSTTPDYKNLIIGKWLWYKTITTGNASTGNPFDTFYNKGMFKEFLPNGKVINTETNGTVYTQDYFIKGSKLAQVYNNGQDTGYSEIIACNAGAFSIYDKAIYTNVNPPAVVEYWNYFVK